MIITRRTAIAGLGASLIATRFARAQTNDTIKIGILQDASGPYSYLGGAGSIACAHQAAKEVSEARGVKVEFLTADHQNKPDIGVAIARQWLDQGVDALLEFNNSGVALAVSPLVAERDRVILGNNIGSANFSGKACTANNTHWVFDTAMLARAVGTAVVEEGGDEWFFIRADYAFGKALTDDTSAVVEKKGGKVIGQVAVPLGTADFASALLQAQASKAKVVALALAGGDLLNCLKQASEFNITGGGQKLACLILYISDIHSLGLPAVKGTELTESFYWDLNDRTRAFAKRVSEAMGGKPPNMGQAGAYSAVHHYLNAVADLGVATAKASGRATVVRMKQNPIRDDVLSNASMREDGRVVSDVYLFQVKTPEESKSEWDVYNVKKVIPPEQAWRPMSEGGCPLVKT